MDLCYFSDEILGRILQDESTAHQAWNRLQDIYLNNKGHRATALETEFSNLRLQNFPSIEAYCQRIRDVGNQLADVGIPMSDERMVIHLVNGLLIEYDATGSYINQAMPTWERAFSMLDSEPRDQSSPGIAVAVNTPPTYPNQNTNRLYNSRGGSGHNQNPGPNTRHPDDSRTHNMPRGDT
ncbi:uncharacterized protein LOC143540929 [Bidens hawaiensis]|uniref:uncharacterized protein LOC143540929 n=1 Tax=Bidens hawaiensis TaxID=980011 RepID=UPI00404952CC